MFVCNGFNLRADGGGVKSKIVHPPACLGGMEDFVIRNQEGRSRTL